MTADEQRVAGLVREAFVGVTLGAGVGLLQGQGLDDYADENTLAEYRVKDEKDDWSAIPASQLNCCQSSLSFFDSEGMRFHLPAYLIADLEGTLDQDILFHLTYFEYEGMSRFHELNGQQREAVRQFLILRLADSDFERSMIEKALAEYWTPDAT